MYAAKNYFSILKIPIILQDGNSQIEKNLAKDFALEVPEELLDMIYVGKASDFDLDESVVSGNIKRSQRSQPGQVSDFNLWNRSLSNYEMIEWTKCK